MKLKSDLHPRRYATNRDNIFMRAEYVITTVFDESKKLKRGD
jgi:hypothetical protein